MDMLSFDSPSFWLSNQLKERKCFKWINISKRKVLSLTDSLHELPHQPVSCDSRKAKIPVLHNRIIPIMMKGSLKPPTWNKNMYIMEWKKGFCYWGATFLNLSLYILKSKGIYVYILDITWSYVQTNFIFERWWCLSGVNEAIEWEILPIRENCWHDRRPRVKAKSVLPCAKEW